MDSAEGEAADLAAEGLPAVGDGTSIKSKSAVEAVSVIRDLLYAIV